MDPTQNPHVYTLFTQSPLPMCLCDADSRELIDINDSMLGLLGYSREEFFALPSEQIERLFSMYSAGDMSEVWLELQEKGSITRLVNYRVHQGQEALLKITSTLVEDPPGHRVVWCQAERQSSTLSERFSHWFEDLETNVFFYRHTVTDGRLMDLSDSFEKVFGIPREEAIGQSWATIVQWNPQTMAIAAEKLAALRPGMSDQMDMEFIHPNGEQRTIKVVSHMFVDEQGRVCIDGSAEDITVRKEMENDLREARAEAERANRAKSAFLAQVSHELRTPLNAIMSFSQLLQVENLAPGHSALLQDIRYSSDHLMQLISDLLDMQQIELGKVQLEIKPVDVAQLIDGALRMVETATEKNGVQIEDFASEGLWVQGDSRRIQQVLINLLSNAVKYNRENGRVHVVAEQVQGEMLRISVSDTGMGISEANQARLFEPFERLGADKTTVEGLGLGLAITKQIIGLMNGRLGVVSKEGEGSTFWFELPTAEAVSDESAVGGSGPSVSAIDLSDARVVYIEDNQINAKIVEHILQRYFAIQAQVALSAGEGLELIRRERPSLVVVDIDLPDMSGYDVLAHIADEPTLKGVPIIALTGHFAASDRERGLRAGFSEYLEKPLDIEKFVGAVSRALIGGGEA